MVDRLIDGASRKVGTLIAVAAGCLFWAGRDIFNLFLVKILLKKEDH